MLLPKQVWKDIEGYEGLYQVSNTGKVRSMNYKQTGKVKRLKPIITNTGYCTARFGKEGKWKGYLVHRLVAQAFIPNPNNLPCVNHKDENKTNNCIWNLEWCTHEYNNNYGSRTERFKVAIKGENNPMYGKKGKDNPNSKPILMLDKNNNILACFDSVGDANEYFDKPRRTHNICACATGRQKTAYGYKWAYINIITL